MKINKKFASIILFAMVLSAFSITAAAQAEPSGAYLKFSVEVNKPDGESLAYNYYFIVQNLGYVLQDGDTLEYDVWISIEETGWGHIDGDINGANLRDRGFSDNEGTGFHTGQDISYYAYERWWHRSVEMGTEEYAGQKLNSIQLSMHPAVDENNYSGYALYDNIVITNNGEIKLVIFKDVGDLDPEKFRLSHQKDSSGKVELLVFTPEEEQAFIDAEEARIQAEIEKEAARIAAAEQREKEAAERAAAEAEEAERLAAEQAAAEQENEEKVSDSTGNAPADNNKSDVNIGLIIVVAVGVTAIIIIIIVIARKKKA